MIHLLFIQHILSTNSCLWICTDLV